MSEPRSTSQRRADTLAALGRNGDAFLATATAAGEPHLIAVTAVWTGEDIVVATRSGSPTGRNLAAAGARARLAIGAPDDVVMVEAVVAEAVDATETAHPLATAFRDGAGWDPAEEGADWRCFRLRPERVQAYRGYGEQAGRDVMRAGSWLG